MQALNNNCTGGPGTRLLMTVTRLNFCSFRTGHSLSRALALGLTNPRFQDLPRQGANTPLRSQTVARYAKGIRIFTLACRLHDQPPLTE